MGDGKDAREEMVQIKRMWDRKKPVRGLPRSSMTRDMHTGGRKTMRCRNEAVLASRG